MRRLTPGFTPVPNAFLERAVDARPTARQCRVLLAAMRLGYGCGGRGRVRLSRAELAAVTGIHPSDVAATLERLRERGLAAYGAGTLVLLPGRVGGHHGDNPLVPVDNAVDGKGASPTDSLAFRRVLRRQIANSDAEILA